MIVAQHIVRQVSTYILKVLSPRGRLAAGPICQYCLHTLRCATTD